MQQEFIKKDIKWCETKHNKDRDGIFLCRMCGLYKSHSKTSHVHQAYDTFCKQCITFHEHLLFLF